MPCGNMLRATPGKKVTFNGEFSEVRNVGGVSDKTAATKRKRSGQLMVMTGLLLLILNVQLVSDVVSLYVYRLILNFQPYKLNSEPFHDVTTNLRSVLSSYISACIDNSAPLGNCPVCK